MFMVSTMAKIVAPYLDLFVSYNRFCKCLEFISCILTVQIDCCCLLAVTPKTHCSSGTMTNHSSLFVCHQGRENILFHFQAGPSG